MVEERVKKGKRWEKGWGEARGKGAEKGEMEKKGKWKGEGRVKEKINRERGRFYKPGFNHSTLCMLASALVSKPLQVLFHTLDHVL